MQERAKGCLPIDINALKKERGTALSWLGGAGFLLASAGTTLLIDPCLHTDAHGITEAGHTAFYPMPLAPGQVPDNAVVLYTHSDGDHMGLKTALDLPLGVRFCAPAPCIRALRAAGVADDRLQLIKPGDAFDVSSMHISVIAADHAWQVCDPAAYGDPFGPEDCAGYIIRTNEAKLLFPGDTRLCPHHLALPNDFDAMALDVSSDPFHLGHENVARLAAHLSHAALLPSHYGTYDAPDAVPHNGSLTALKALLGADASRVLPDVIGHIIRFPAKED